MKFKFVKSALATLTLAATFMITPTHAGFIDYGALTLLNDGDIYVTDSINGVDWLRWDQVKTLNYSQLQTAIGAGGAFDGWSIARNADMNDFTNALFEGLSTCDNLTMTQSCTGAVNFDYALFNKLMGKAYDYDPSHNFAWFLSDNGIEQEVGFVQAYKDNMYKFNEGTNLTNSDQYSNVGMDPDLPIGFQLYRESDVAVPEPSTLAIFALGMIGLASRRLSRQS
ncbi:MAG: PEP-CTERM sorting domain-containing protein [Alteromonadales bacterium]|nr:PEP-CTERM sorting domain-containing protein [Alteromonadales bacterium]